MFRKNKTRERTVGGSHKSTLNRMGETCSE